MIIKIVGFDCSNGIKVIKNIEKASRNIEVDIELEKIPSNEKNKYNIKDVPALIVDEKIISSGYVPSDREISHIIKEYVES